MPGRGSFVLTDETDLSLHNWVPRTLQTGGYDGVSKVVLMHHDDWTDPSGRKAASMVMHRAIREQRSNIRLRVALSDYTRPRRIRPRVDHALLHLCGIVAAIVFSDIHRQTTRARERQSPKPIEVDVDASGLPDGIREAAPHWVAQRVAELAGPLSPEAALGSMNEDTVEV